MRQQSLTCLHLEHFLAVVISSPHTLQHSRSSSDTLRMRKYCNHYHLIGGKCVCVFVSLRVRQG